jgi:hypothetical protein
MKTISKKKISAIAMACMALTLGKVCAQNNTSYKANTIPILGANCTAFGEHALYTNGANGQNNTATGYYALALNTYGSRNAAHGTQALVNNTTGTDNTANGYQALFKSTEGFGNVANGSLSLYYNTDGYWNTAIGKTSLYNNLGGHENTAIGKDAMYANTTGFLNSACGLLSLERNTTGYENVAVGYKALVINTTGYRNTAIGSSATVGSVSLSNATAIGYGATVNASNKIRLGNTSVTVVEGPVAYTVSDGRFKNNISESDVKGLEFIKRLRPVVYNFDTRKLEEFLTKNIPAENQRKLDDNEFAASTAIRQSGFIAQEVEKAAQDAGYNFNGVHKPENDDDNYSLAYGQFVVPLVKGMQEQQAMIEKQQAMIEQQQKQINELKKLVGTKTAVISEVSALKDIEIYPNPSGGIVNIRTKGIETGVIEVIDLEGKSIYKTEVTNNSSDYKIDLSGYAHGIYLVTISSKGQEVSTKKLIIE